MPTSSRKPGDVPTKKPKKSQWRSPQTMSACEMLAATDAKLWQDALIWVLEQGHGLVVTRTKDDTAVHLTLLTNAEKLKRICTSPDDLIEALSELEDV